MDSHQAHSSNSEGGVGWQSFLKNPMSRLENSYTHSKFTDLNITFPGHPEVLKVHRLVLAISSPVFERMLFGSLAEKGDLNLPEDPPEAFYWLINSIYSDETNFPDDDIDLTVEIYHLANKYQMRYILSSCSDHLVNEVNARNLPVVYDVAVLYEDTSLLNQCSEVMSKTAGDVLSSPEVGQLKRTAMKHLFQQELYVNSEVTVFQGLVNWGTSQVSRSTVKSPHQSIREEIEEFLPQIRFLTMTLNEFVGHVLPSNVLTPEESNAILMNIKLAGNFPIPVICSPCRNRRRNFDHQTSQQFTLQLEENVWAPDYNIVLPTVTIKPEYPLKPEYGVFIITNMTVTQDIFIGDIQFDAPLLCSDDDMCLCIVDVSISEEIPYPEVGTGTLELMPKQNQNGSLFGATFVLPTLLTKDKRYGIIIMYANKGFNSIESPYYGKLTVDHDDDLTVVGEVELNAIPLTINFWKSF